MSPEDTLPSQHTGDDRKSGSIVLFIYRQPKPGGIATYLDNLTRALVSLGEDVEVLALVESDEEERLAVKNTRNG